MLDDLRTALDRMVGTITSDRRDRFGSQRNREFFGTQGILLHWLRPLMLPSGNKADAWALAYFIGGIANPRRGLVARPGQKALQACSARHSRYASGDSPSATILNGMSSMRDFKACGGGLIKVNRLRPPPCGRGGPNGLGGFSKLARDGEVRVASATRSEERVQTIRQSSPDPGRQHPERPWDPPD